MKLEGIPDKVLKTANDIYNKGYKDGVDDACKQLSRMAESLRESAIEALGDG